MANLPTQLDKEGGDDRLGDRRNDRTPLPPAIRQQLDALRGKIRGYVWREGLAATAVWLGVVFWGSMALDWSFELPRALRLVVLAVAGAGLALVFYRFIVRRAFVHLSDGNMATILERQFPQLNDSLLTYVSHCEHPAARQEFNPQMLSQTGDLAERRLESALTGKVFDVKFQVGGYSWKMRLDSVRLGEVFDPMPIVRKVVIALGLASAICLLAGVAPSVLDLWARRNLFLAEALWPRSVRLEALGFTDDGEGHLVAKVAKGANFDLRVQAFRADTEIPVVPEKVEIRYRYEGGARERRTMKNIGHTVTAAAATQRVPDEPLQEYSHQFTGVLNSAEIDIAGGDARIPRLKLVVVPNPNLNLELVCEYPPYMERASLTIPSVSGAVPIRVPVGSRITIHGMATKPLEKLEIDSPGAEGGAALHRQFLSTELGPEQNEFTHTFEPFPGPKADPIKTASEKESKPAANAPREFTVQFALRDCDGLKAREPILLTLVAVPDEPPEVKVRLVGTREPVVTPKGRLPVTGTVSDDHGLNKIWWNYTVEERAPPALAQHLKDKDKEAASSPKPTGPTKPPPQRSGEVLLAVLPKHQAEYAAKDAVLKASEISLATGQRLNLAVRAADLCTFGNGPNIGSGESWQLDVVSEDELVTRLEARELLIKQRYEQIVEEMTETRNLLLKMDFTPPEKEEAIGTGNKTTQLPGAGARPKPKMPGAEPGEREADAPKLTLEKLNERRLERTLQALQNCRKNSLETADVAAAIEEIRIQLDNNEANNGTRRQRIETQVLQPLHVIVDSMFPVLDRRIVALQEKIDNLSVGPQRRDVALRQADQILAMMRDVLDHMMKAEDFNINVVQRLKKIIERQKELTRLTEKTEQDSLKD
jgi:hypothetical protein